MTEKNQRPAFYRSADAPLRLGISACLLGREVRYDGRDSFDSLIAATLGQGGVELTDICPEVECGLPVPREAIQLEGAADAPQVIAVETRRDITRQISGWVGRRIRQLKDEALDGYIFKSRSPSCGVKGVKLFKAGGGNYERSGVGLFAAAFQKAFPLLPVADEASLVDGGARENFIERLFALRRYRDYLANGGSRGGLVQFHSDHKLQIMAHSVETYRSLGRLVADLKKFSPAQLRSQYEEQFVRALRLMATRPKNVNVLQHAFGYFKTRLDSAARADLLQLIDRYRNGLVPLTVPQVLLSHYARILDVPYLSRQFYINPEPAELRLRTVGGY